jgi:RluA family pseudouridine synthase
MDTSLVTRCDEKTLEFAQGTAVLPGLTPYDNRRPMHVRGEFDGVPLSTYLSAAHPHVSLETWRRRAESHCLSLGGRPVVDFEVPVRAGNELIHLERGVVEPVVDTDLRFLYTDDALSVVEKPAPMPVHPSGRYNKHSMVSLLKHVFPDQQFLPVHRLDADTTGLMILAHTKVAARHLARQFEARTVRKTYLAEVKGRVEATQFHSRAPVSKRPSHAGRREIDGEGQGAWTEFRVRDRAGDTTLLEVVPHSGRTNQIRVHLASEGLPILGDAPYGEDASMKSGTSRLRLHAWRIGFEHPISGDRVDVEARTPGWAGRESV